MDLYRLDRDLEINVNLHFKSIWVLFEKESQITCSYAILFFAKKDDILAPNAIRKSSFKQQAMSTI